ncbi:hypothetical protein QQP08_014099 [Theobroma cacao]|uniref:Uncharacterized protein n=1 Tax=Theobroma cacao TaxID=3641 RepID=A0A061EQN2_THECC|nr:Uncharacterized protein TCM_019838 [Theobroma cacao]WRX21612.1 hypothetical protein QQP08_014099 [Theobroma cacao]
MRNLVTRSLHKLLPHEQAMLPRSKIVYADVYGESLIDMITHPQRYANLSTGLQFGIVFIPPKKPTDPSKRKLFLTSWMTMAIAPLNLIQVNYF